MDVIRKISAYHSHKMTKMLVYCGLVKDYTESSSVINSCAASFWGAVEIWRLHFGAQS